MIQVILINLDSKLTQLLGNFDIDLEKSDKDNKSDIVIRFNIRYF